MTLNAFLNYDIETGYDYLYLTVNGTHVHTSLSDPAQGEGITDTSGGAWVPVTANLSAFAGQTVTLPGSTSPTAGSPPRAP